MEIQYEQELVKSYNEDIVSASNFEKFWNGHRKAIKDWPKLEEELLEDAVTYFALYANELYKNKDTFTISEMHFISKYLAILNHFKENSLDEQYESLIYNITLAIGKSLDLLKQAVLVIVEASIEEKKHADEQIVKDMKRREQLLALYSEEKTRLYQEQLEKEQRERDSREDSENKKSEEIALKARAEMEKNEQDFNELIALKNEQRLEKKRQDERLRQQRIREAKAKKAEEKLAAEKRLKDEKIKEEKLKAEKLKKERMEDEKAFLEKEKEKKRIVAEAVKLAKEEERKVLKMREESQMMGKELAKGLSSVPKVAAEPKKGGGRWPQKAAALEIQPDPLVQNLPQSKDIAAKKPIKTVSDSVSRTTKQIPKPESKRDNKPIADVQIIDDDDDGEDLFPSSRQSKKVKTELRMDQNKPLGQDFGRKIAESYTNHTKTLVQPSKPSDISIRLQKTDLSSKVAKPIPKPADLISRTPDLALPRMPDYKSTNDNTLKSSAQNPAAVQQSQRSKMNIYVVNEFKDESKSVSFNFVHINNNLMREVERYFEKPQTTCCKCIDPLGCKDITSCPCAKKNMAINGVSHAYEVRIIDGQPRKYLRESVDSDFHIFECGKDCGCQKDLCNNSMLSNSKFYELNLFDFVVKRYEKGTIKVNNKRASSIRMWGLMTRKSIKRGAFVIEYVGELISKAEGDRRGQTYDVQGENYLFDLNKYVEVKDDKEKERTGKFMLEVDGHKEERSISLKKQIQKDFPLVIDAYGYGNLSRFINHSCSPNLQSISVHVGNSDLLLPRIALFAKVDILPGEELTIDYECSPVTVDRGLECLCGSDRCRGYLYKSANSKDVKY